MSVSSYTSRAQNACTYCRRRKRACDMRLPTCSTCLGKDIICEYSQLLEDGPQIPGQGPKFPSVFFLDSVVYQYSYLDLPRISLPLPAFVVDHVGDTRAVANGHFETVHAWMPLISKKRFFDHLLNPLSEPRADVLMLMFCMKLLRWSPPHDGSGRNATTKAYITAKQFLLSSDIAGQLTLQILQANLLVALYELGHGLYPAAYLSVGACARYAIALGIHDQSTTHYSNTLHEPIEQEERRRAWWTVIILDRLINLGNPKRPPSTQDPDLDHLLPADDAAWDMGIVNNNQLFPLSSPANVKMGMFARLAQSTFLLGRVFRHNADSPTDQSFYEQETMQLDRTIRALINLSYLEGQIRRMAVCAQTAICYSALMILHDPLSSRADQDHVKHAMAILKPVAEETSLGQHAFLAGTAGPLEKASPLLLHWAYQAATVYSRILRTTGNPELGSMETFTLKLKVMSQKWLAADAYLQILGAREVMSLDQIHAGT